MSQPAHRSCRFETHTRCSFWQWLPSFIYSPSTSPFVASLLWLECERVNELTLHGCENEYLKEGNQCQNGQSLTLLRGKWFDDCSLFSEGSHHLHVWMGSTNGLPFDYRCSSCSSVLLDLFEQSLTLPSEKWFDDWLVYLVLQHFWMGRIISCLHSILHGIRSIIITHFLASIDDEFRFALIPGLALSLCRFLPFAVCVVVFLSVKSDCWRKIRISLKPNKGVRSSCHFFLSFRLPACFIFVECLSLPRHC